MTSRSFVTIPTSISNAYLLFDERPVLVDAGGPKDVATVLAGLAAHGVAPQDLAALILTHAHTDHTGAAEHLGSLGVPIVVGAADVRQLHRGVNDDLPPTGWAGRLLKPISMRMTTRPAEATILVDATRDFADLGVDISAEVVGGHTAGSMIIRHAGYSLVGDLVRGGFLAGRVMPTHPLQHYFVEDSAAVRKAIESELEQGSDSLLCGHGGPLSALDVRRRLDQVAPRN